MYFCINFKEVKYTTFFFAVILLCTTLIGCDPDVNESLETKSQLEEMETYLKDKGLNREYKFSNAGFYYKVLTLGDGSPARGSQIIYTHLSIVDFRSKTVYYDNFAKGELLPINVTQSISAISQMMNFVNTKSENANAVAGKIEALVPSNLAYRTQGSDLVPPNTPLIITLEIEDVYNLQQQQTKELALLAEVVKQDRYKGFTFDSPLYYKISKLGTGRNINSNQVLNMSYRYADINQPDVTLFKTDGIQPIQLGNLPADLVRSLSLLRISDSQAQFVLPSTAAFGIFGNEYVKPNTNLFFEITVGKN